MEIKDFFGKKVKVTIDQGDKAYIYRGRLLSVGPNFVTMDDIKSGCVQILIKKIITIEEADF